MTAQAKIMVGLCLGLVAVGLVMYRRGAAQLGADIGGAAVAAVDGAVSGAVVGAGGLVGIPATNQTQCQQDMAAGRTWDASFSCPAGDFLRYVFK